MISNTTNFPSGLPRRATAFQGERRRTARSRGWEGSRANSGRSLPAIKAIDRGVNTMAESHCVVLLTFQERAQGVHLTSVFQQLCLAGCTVSVRTGEACAETRDKDSTASPAGSVILALEYSRGHWNPGLCALGITCSRNQNPFDKKRTSIFLKHPTPCHECG